MTTYIEYELTEGPTVLVQINDSEAGGVVKASHTGEPVIIKASKSFGDALTGIQAQAKEFMTKLKPTEADEIEVKFSLKSTGELGNFAIGSVGLEAAYEVTLKWKNSPRPKT